MGRHTTRELPVELQQTALSDMVFHKKAVKTNERDPDNTPANSRLFVVCGKDMSEQDLYELFNPYGKIEYCRLIKDKKSGESKGLCYIKYEKASSAAGALENIDGKQIHENGTVMKVHIADAKGTAKNRRKLYSTEPEDTPPRSRLFVVCPKEMTEETLHSRFKQIEGLEYCKVIADKHTGESKGFAYVKFNKASAAALAMESVSESGEIDSMKVKVLIADPKNKRVNTDYFSMNPMEGVFSYPIQIPPYAGVPPFVFPMNYPMVQPRLLVSCHKSVSLKELTNLFVHIPGMEHCEFVPMPTMRANGEDQLRYAYVYFSNLQTALLAIDQCNGIEYPAGWTLKCGLEPPIVLPPNNSPPETSFLMPTMYTSNYQVQDGYGTMGMYPPLPMGYTMNYCPPEQSMEYYQPQEIASPVVSFNIPGGLSSEEAYNYFGRYGHLEEVDVSAEDYGHVVFSDIGSANAAVSDLDGKVIDGRQMEAKFAC